MTTQSGAAVGCCVFDAYGTLFDVNSAAARSRDELGPQAERLAELWRSKQLEYTWLRSLMGRHADFWQVTSDALDYAMAVLKLEGGGLRQRLMESYLSLDAYPEVPAVLSELQAAGLRCAILSNGSPRMLAAAVAASGIGSRLEAVLSVESVGIYKPHPSVYQLAVERMAIPAKGICFLSSNSWDVAGAAAFGFRAVWVNRRGQCRERLPSGPEAEMGTLAPLPRLLEAWRADPAAR